MLIGLCGAICSGKQTIADYLVQHHGFTQLHLQQELAIGRSLALDTVDVSGNSRNGEESPPAPAEIDSIGPHSHNEHTFTFDTADLLLDFVTKSWQSLWVTTDIHSEATLDKLDRRPFFILVSVDAPIYVRWKRFQGRQRLQQAFSLSRETTSPRMRSHSSLSLEDFVQESDEHLYNSKNGLLPLISRAAIKLLNTSSDIAHFYARLAGVNLLNNDRLRPTWDQYFMQLASLGAQRSNCMKRRVGCVIVEDKRVISTGYNGTPRGLKNCADGGCPRCNEGQGSGVGLGTCLCLHAEENALLEAGRGRIRKGTILYCDTCPCLTCSIKIAQVGISEVVYSQGYSMDRDTADVFKQAGVRLRQFIPPANGMIHLER